MGLEKFIHMLYSDTHSRITSRSKERITETIDILNHHTYTLSDSFLAVKASAALYRRNTRGLAGYETLADKLTTQTEPILPKTNNFEAYKTLTQSRTQYKTRFKEIKTYLSSGMYYHDAVQCLDEIQTNNYLQRKAKKDFSFNQERQEMILELEEYVHECEQHFLTDSKSSLWKKTKKVGYTALAAGWGSLLAYASMPF
jgi:hypothetical protein